MTEFELINQTESEYWLNVQVGRFSKWEKLIFSILSILYKRPEVGSSQSGYHRSLFYFCRLLVAVQYASLIWTLNVSISGWKNFNMLWYIIQYSRFDIICAEVNSSQNCMIFAYSFYSGIFFLSSLLVLLRLITNKVSSRVIYFLGKFLIFTESVSIPLFIILMLVLKYSLLHGNVAEYTQTVSMDYSTFGIVMSLSCLSFIVFVQVCNNVFDYDCRHFQAKVSPEGRVNSNIDLLSILAGFLSVFFYAFVLPSSSVFYMALLMTLHGIVALGFFYYLPYYHFYANFAKSLPHVFVFISCIIIIVGHVIDNGLFFFLGLLFVIPLVLYLWHSSLLYRLSKIKFDNIKDAKSVWEFEICIRDRLINYKEDQSQEILETFNVIFLNKNFEKTKFLIVSEASYCFFSFNDQRLGLAKLYRDCKIKKSLEESYQFYIIRKDMKKIAFDKYQEYKLISKLEKTQKILKIDKEMCFEAYKFYKYLLSSEKPSKNLEKSVEVVQTYIEKVERSYNKVILKFKDSYALIDLYSSFIECFYGDTEKSLSISSKKESNKKLNKSKELYNLSNLIETNPLMLVSAKDYDFGKIIHSNQELADLLGYDRNDINKRIFTDFFPTTINNLSIQSLKKFKMSYFSTFYMEENLFALNSKGFIIEVSITIILLGFYEQILLFSIKKIEKPREIALLTNKFIAYYTEGLEDLFKGKKILGCKANTLVDIDFKDFKISKTQEIEIDSIKILIYYKKKIINDEKIKYLQLYKEKKNSTRKITIRMKKKTLNSKKNSFIATDRIYPTKGSINTSSLIESEPDYLELKKIDYSSTLSSSNKSLAKVKAYSEDSITAIKYFKRILLICVRNMQTITIILFNCGLLIYSSLIIQSSLSKTSLNIIGETLFCLASLSDLSSLIQLSFENNAYPNPDYVIRLNQTQTKLSEVLNNYTDYNSNWNDCEASELFFEESIPYISFQNYSITYTTMYNFIYKTTVTTASLRQKVVANDTNIDEEVYLLQGNGLGIPSQFIRTVLNKVYQCQDSQTINFSYIKEYMIIAGLLVLCVCVVATIPFVLFIRNRLKLLWNFIRSTAKQGSKNLDQLCISRLKEFHSMNDQEISETVANDTMMRSDRLDGLNSSTKYFLILSLFILIGFLIYLVSYFVFFAQFEIFMTNRPKIFMNLILSRISISRLGYYALQVMQKDAGLEYSKYNPLNPDYSSELNQAITDLHYNTQNLLNSDYSQLIGSQLFTCYFVKSSGGEQILEYGNYPGITNTIFEGLYIAYSKDTVNRESLIDGFYDDLKILTDESENLFSSISNYSKDFVQQYLKNFILFFSSLSSLLLVLYGIFYYTFFAHEQKKILRIEFISKIIFPSNAQKKP